VIGLPLGIESRVAGIRIPDGQAPLHMRILKFSLFLILSCSSLAFAAKLQQVAMVDLPGNPGFNQVAIANGQLVITRPENNTIEIFSPVKRRVIARISQVDNPRGIAVDDASSRVYVALAGSNRIAVVNSTNWQVEQLISLKSQPEKLLWVPETKTLFVSSLRDRSVGIVDLRIAAETSDIDLEALPQDMIYDSAQQRLLVSLQEIGQVIALDRSNKISGRFKLAASEPTGLALDPIRRRLYVAVRYAVLVLNADTGSEISRIAAPGGTNSLSLDSTHGLLYAAAGDGSVLAIDLERGVADYELPTNVKGYSIVYDARDKMLFFPGGREGRAKLVILRPIAVNDNPGAQTAGSSAPPKQQTALK
jgi:DNA-binding beta-propeller fold protein YncE